MKIIYETRGKAKEYCTLAVNLYKGCDHGCKYCYAPSATFTTREKFNNHQEPRKNIIEKLKKDAEKHPGNGQQVLLSFTSDPYQHLDQELQLTRQAIKILKENGYNVVILSKGGNNIKRDFDLLDNDDYIGATLTFNNKEDSLKWEPGAALPEERIQVLKEAHDRINTWVSLEPVIVPEQTLDLIDETHQFVDMYKIGKLNYHQEIEEKIDWREFATKAIGKMKKYNKNYYIKNDLRKYITKPA